MTEKSVMYWRQRQYTDLLLKGVVWAKMKENGARPIFIGEQYKRWGILKTVKGKKGQHQQSYEL